MALIGFGAMQRRQCFINTEIETSQGEQNTDLVADALVFSVCNPPMQDHPHTRLLADLSAMLLILPRCRVWRTRRLLFAIARFSLSCIGQNNLQVERMKINRISRCGHTVGIVDIGHACKVVTVGESKYIQLVEIFQSECPTDQGLNEQTPFTNGSPTRRPYAIMVMKILWIIRKWIGISAKGTELNWLVAYWSNPWQSAPHLSRVADRQRLLSMLERMSKACGGIPNQSQTSLTCPTTLFIDKAYGSSRNEEQGSTFEAPPTTNVSGTVRPIFSANCCTASIARTEAYNSKVNEMVATNDQTLPSSSVKTRAQQDSRDFREIFSSSKPQRGCRHGSDW